MVTDNAERRGLNISPARTLQPGASRLGFGTAYLPGGLSKQEALALLETAFENGIRHFDTAPLYGWGEADALIGEFAQPRRDEIAIFTKAGMSAPALGERLFAKAMRREPRPLVNFRPAHVRRSLEQSLRALRTDRVDALLLHEITPHQMSAELAAELEQLRREGKALRIGLATSPAASEVLLAAYPTLFSVVQIPFGTQVRNLGAALLVTHSVFRGRLEQARAVLNGNRADAAEMLWRAALAQNPNGVTLFSSTRADAIRQNATLTAADPATVSAVVKLLRQA